MADTLADYFKKHLKDAINRDIENNRNKKKKQAKTVQRTAKQERKGMGSTGIIGRTKQRKQNRLDQVMGEIRKTRGK